MEQKNIISNENERKLRPCPVCLEMIDETAETCPYCDEPTYFKHAHTNDTAAPPATDYEPAKESMGLWKKVLIGFGCILAALFVIGLFLPDDESKDVAASGCPVVLTVQNVEYWDNLKPQSGNTYEPTNMLDGNPSTAWAVNLDRASYDSDKLYGPTFTVRCKKLSHIIIRNGYAKDEDSFRNNSRASRIIFCNADNVSDENESASYLYEGIVKDTPEPQTLKVSGNANSDIHEIQMIFPVDGLRRGTKWNDLCISEIEFWGWE